MKRTPELLLCLAGLLMVVLGRWQNSASPLKEVHEWGTMTSVAGSDGRQFAWWGNRLTSDGSEQVPEFVQFNSSGGKQSFEYIQRMETPVLYFYPTKPIPISVSVKFGEGRITEFFPSDGLVQRTRPYRVEKSGEAITWHLNLLRPDSEKSRLLPKIGKQGSQYAAAREVPEAWLVQRALNCSELGDSLPSRSRSDEVEKFLFYRGASGLTTLTLTPWNDEKSIDLMTYFSELYYGKNPTPAWWILKVSGERAAWKRIPSPAAKGKNDWPSSEVDIPALPKKGTPPNLDQVAAELRQEMFPVLVTAGLSENEAKAMLNTWNDTWFKEPGVRLLFLLPQGWVDQVLPLTITPKPQKISRVFIARVEMLSPQTEKILLETLDEGSRNEGAQDSPVLLKRIKDLELGRFTGAGMQRAINLRSQRMENAGWYMNMRLNN